MLGNHAIAGSPLAAIYTTLPNAVLGELGSYTLSGQAAALRIGRNVVAAAGSYSIDGQTVSFTISLSQAAIGQVALVGSTSVLISGFKMITNFVMTAGDDKTLVVTVKDANGTAVNITGASIKWQCARSFGKASDISKTTSSGISITDGANGVFTVTLTAANTESLRGNFYHEAQLTDSGGAISTVLFGTMKVNPALIEAT